MLLAVPNFTGIYFHIGNRDDDTSGCLLSGTYPRMYNSNRWEVVLSTDNYRASYPKIADGILKDENNSWEIIDEFS